MGFGRNPYVSKAQLAEQKAADAVDDASRVRALREAAHEWDRAAEREKPGRTRDQYEKNALKNRNAADGEAPPEDDASSAETSPQRSVDAIELDPRFLN